MSTHIAKVSFKSLATALAVFCLTAASALAAPVKNIVLVHGAWVDGSGWKPVYEILVRDGYNVTMVQEPETSFEADLRTKFLCVLMILCIFHGERRPYF